MSYEAVRHVSYKVIRHMSNVSDDFVRQVSNDVSHKVVRHILHVSGELGQTHTQTDGRTDATNSIISLLR